MNSLHFFGMSGGARLLYILRRGYALHGDDRCLNELRQLAAKLIGMGCEVAK